MQRQRISARLLPHRIHKRALHSHFGSLSLSPRLIGRDFPQIEHLVSDYLKMAPKHFIIEVKSLLIGRSASLTPHHIKT